MKNKKRGNGEGSIYYNEEKKRWVGQKVFGTRSDGKPNRITRYGKTKKECIERLFQYETEWKNGTLIEPTRLTVHDIVLLQIDNDFDLNKISETTKRRRLFTLQIIDDYMLGAVLIKDLNAFQIMSFFKRITHYSNSTLSKVFQAVNKCCRYAKKKKFISENPFDDKDEVFCPKSDKPDKKISALTVDEQQRLIELLNNEEKDNRYRWQMLIMLCTGMRMGEINALKISDINFVFNTININKTISMDENDNPILGKQTKTDSGNRILELTPTLKALLEDYINNHYKENPDRLLFYNFKKKGYISTNQVNSSFKRIVERYNVIPMIEEMLPLSSKGRKKISFKKYTYFKKVGNEYKLIGSNPPSDWDTNFGNYYFKQKVAEKDYNLHMLRHTFATRCIENEIDYKTLSEILGHKDITVTINTYCDVIGRFKKQQYIKIENIQNSFNILNQNAEITATGMQPGCNRKAF